MRRGLPGLQRQLVASLLVLCSLYMLCFINTVERLRTNENAVGFGYSPRPSSASSSAGQQPIPVSWHGISSSPYNYSALAENDFSSLVNLTNFKYNINSLRCGVIDDDTEDSVFLVVFVHSAPSNFDKRQVIRQTWGNESLFETTSTRTRLVFMLGSVANDSLQRAIEQENDMFEDIVQGNFDDSYRNLTYKHVMGLKWVTYFCPQAKFVFKTDDDIFVDIFQLMFYLKGQMSLLPVKNLMSCYVITNPYPKRSQRSKWRVSFKEYPHKYYPRYCSGWGIIMSPDVVFKLYAQSTSLPYFWVDDVHVSGLLASRVGVVHNDFNLKLAIGSDEIDGWLEQKDTLSLPPLFGHPDSSAESIVALWNKTVQYYKSKYANKTQKIVAVQ